MSSSLPADRAELIDQLSAYLDNELDAEASRQIEQLLAADPQARDALKQLQQACGLLDDLPSRDVEPSFTETTISMIALAEIDARSPSRSPRRWGAALLGGVGVLGALACGFAVVALIRPKPNDVLLRDLPVLENLEAYRHAGTVDFLRRLKAQKLFTEPEAAKPEDTHAR